MFPSCALRADPINGVLSVPPPPLGSLVCGPWCLIMAQQATPSSQKALMMELKSLQEQPVEGFRITLVEESDLYNWEVAIFGPPNTLYEGGYFKAHIKFPVDYPYSPPTFRFLTKMWHPNIYENGDVCISILHPPVDDPQSGELPSERWNPTQNVRKQVLSTAAEAERDGVKVPTTLAEYCVQTRVPSQDSSSDLLYDDLYDDDMEEEDEEDDESEMESVGEAGGIGSLEDAGTSTRRYDNQDDSGNEDS
uniref:Ubiquitin-conjugating enzyme E2R 2 n=1 Tax=Fundulus heteroclitus TaxID=8078 RepID=A0A3Q2UQZ6_FUNHE